VGVQVDRKWWAGNLTARFVGFPWLAGLTHRSSSTEDPFALLFSRYVSADEEELDKGYFMEIFSEYRIRAHDSLYAGVFVRWNLIHAEAYSRDLDWYAERWITPSGVDIARATIQRTSWTLGGSLSYAFTTF
jgi:hypothetical protein